MKYKIFYLFCIFLSINITRSLCMEIQIASQEKKQVKEKYKIFPENAYIYHDLAEFCLERDFSPEGKLLKEFKENAPRVLKTLQEKIDKASLKVKILSRNAQEEDFLVPYLPRMYFLFGDAHKQNLEPIFCVDITHLQKRPEEFIEQSTEEKPVKQRAMQVPSKEEPIFSTPEKAWYHHHSLQLGLTGATCLGLGWCAHTWWNSRK